jgi:hypothetical protein
MGEMRICPLRGQYGGHALIPWSQTRGNGRRDRSETSRCSPEAPREKAQCLGNQYVVFGLSTAPQRAFGSRPKDPRNGGDRTGQSDRLKGGLWQGR